MAKVEKLKPVAHALGGITAQLAIAWCLRNAFVSSVITGASKPGIIEGLCFSKDDRASSRELGSSENFVKARQILFWPK